MKKKSYLQLIVLIWALIPCYYFLSNSFRTSGYVANTFLISIISVLVLNLAAYFLGGVLFRAIKINTRSFSLKRLHKIAAGYGIIFITLFILGFLSLYTNSVLTGFITLLILLSAFGLYNFINELPVNKSVTFSGTESIYFSIILFVIILDLITTLVPPTLRDSLIHHLAVPKIYLNRGGIVPLDFMTHSFRSLNLELLYMLTLFIKNDIVARAIHFNFYVFSVIALYHFLRGAFSKDSSMIGSMLYASIPVVFNVASSAYVDMGLVFFGILLTDSIRSFYNSEDNLYLMTGGIAAGLCISTKINGYLLVAIMFIWFVMITQRHKLKSGEFLKKIGIFLLFIMIFDSHLILKNLSESKNPFYPVVSLAKGNIFKIGDVEVDMTPAEIRKQIYNFTWQDELKMPWSISTEVESRGEYTVDGILGPIFLIFIPLALFIKRRRYELISFIAIIILYTVVCWGKFGIRLRYLMTLFPICIFLMTAVLDELFRKDGESSVATQFIRSGTLVLLIAIIMLPNIYHISSRVARIAPFDFISGSASREQYLQKHYSRYAIFKYINSHLAGDGKNKIYFFDFGNDGYYSDVDYIYDTFFLGQTMKTIVAQSTDMDEVARRVRDMDITHILINTKYLEDDIEINYLSHEKKRLDEYFNKYLILLKKHANDELYEIIDPV